MREHPVFARVYERISTWANEAGEEEHRIELVGGVEGRALEVGAGNGLNFEHYRGQVAVVAVEPEPTMLMLAANRAARAGVPIALMRGAAEALPFPDATFDTVVCSLVLCSVQDPARALREIARVLRPGGELRFLEHVRSGSPLWGGVQDLVTGPWSMLAGGCHPNRDTLETVRSAGFEFEFRRFPFGPPSPCRPHVLGVARRRR